MRTLAINQTPNIATRPIRRSTQVIVDKTSAAVDSYMNKSKFTSTARKILAKCSEMNVKEYKKLSNIEKALLRLETRKLPKEDYQDDFFIHKKADVDDVITLSKWLLQNLDAKYGKDKYVFCSIGRSPALFANLFKSIGVETKICRYSRQQDYSQFVNHGKKNETTYKQYRDYLKKIGLSADKIKKSDKTYVFIDYVKEGDGLRTFQEIVEDPLIGLKLDNVKFENMNEFVDRPKGDNSPRIKWDYDEYMKNKVLKQYAILPLDKSNPFIKKQYGNKPNDPITDEIKIFRFALFDKVINEKSFKN